MGSNKDHNSYIVSTRLYPTMHQSACLQLGIYTTNWLIDDKISIKGLTAEKKINKWMYQLDDHGLAMAIRFRLRDAILLDQSLRIGHEFAKLGAYGSIRHGTLSKPVSSIDRAEKVKIMRRGNEYIAVFRMVIPEQYEITGAESQSNGVCVCDATFDDLCNLFSKTAHNKRDGYIR